MSCATGICVIGTGWGEYLYRELRSVYSGLVFMCGSNAEKTRRIASKVGADGALAGWHAAVEDPRVGAVVVALPHHLHREAAIAAMNNGKHVLLEKPIATRSADAQEMIDAARRNRVVFHIGENVDFRPDIAEARKLLPEIGPITLVHATHYHRRSPNSWRCIREKMGGGLLMDAGVHYVRAIRLLMGEPDRVYAVSAHQSLTKMDGEDNAVVVLSGDTWQATIRMGWSTDVGSYPEYVLIGESGALKLESNGSMVTMYPSKNRFSGLVSRIRPYWLKNLLSNSELYARRIRIGKDRMGYRSELAEFLRLLGDRSEAYWMVNAKSALRDLEITEAAYQSMREAAPVSISQDCASWTAVGV